MKRRIPVSLSPSRSIQSRTNDGVSHPWQACLSASIQHQHSSHRRSYATHPPSARLNLPTNYSTTPLLHHTSRAALSSPSLAPHLPSSSTTVRQNLYQAINAALSIALATDPTALLFGEDVAFGGVFRCSMDLAPRHGSDRVFNTPLSEQGLVGFALGAAMSGATAIAEVQFADYVYPAFDQLVNEAAKLRYREGTNYTSQQGSLTVRMPCGAVGHGALYHSQSPEALFCHVPGLRVVVPRGPAQAKGLLLAAIRCRDPVVFLEPKMLYRAAVEHVPEGEYELPLSKAEVLREGSRVTVVSYGAPLYTCMDAIARVEEEMRDKEVVELVDLRTVYPWDRPTVVESVRKTGRCVVVHESMVNAGVGAEVAATVQDKCFTRLEAPVQRVAGWSTHSGLLYEKFNVPDVVRVYDAIKQALAY